jgi:hypothetical protein
MHRVIRLTEDSCCSSTLPHLWLGAVYNHSTLSTAQVNLLLSQHALRHIELTVWPLHCSCGQRLSPQHTQNSTTLPNVPCLQYHTLGSATESQHVWG